MSGEERQSEFEALARQLQKSASGSNEVFDKSRPGRWRTAVASQLRRLTKRLSATDALLFQISTRKNCDRIVRLLCRINAPDQPNGSMNNERFPFRLLPSEIQDGLNQQIAIQVFTENGGGGRLLQQIQSSGNMAMIVPICRRDKMLVGMLIFLVEQNPFAELSADQVRRLTELLQLNGSLLLSNIRRQKKASKHRRKMAQWKQIADCACDFALEIDGQLLITQAVPFGSGQSCPNARGLRLTDIVERTFHRRLKQQIGFALKDGNVRTVEFRIKLGAEEPTWHHARIEPRVDSIDDHCMLYLTNNNQDKRLQTEINLLNEQLIRASRLSLLGQMSTEFAHQINQPLQAILGFANLTLTRIRKGAITTEQTLKAMLQIETSVTHCANIIDSIRDFARYRSLKVQPVTLASLLDNAIMMVTERASQLNGAFVVHALPDHCVVMADRTQSTHVFINLFVNALEATAEFGVDQPLINIFVEDDPDGKQIIVAVKDNGPGLPIENPDQVFAKFHTKKEDGLGLGLAISRDVCESQQGSLTAINNRDEAGCTFQVRFRAAKADFEEMPVDEDSI